MLRAVNLCSKNSHIFDEFCRHYWVWSHNLGGYRHRNQGLGRRVAWLPPAAWPLWTLEDGAPRGLSLAPSELRRDRGDGAVPGDYCPGGDHHWDRPTFKDYYFTILGYPTNISTPLLRNTPTSNQESKTFSWMKQCWSENLSWRLALLQNPDLKLNKSLNTFYSIFEAYKTLLDNNE